MCNQRLRVNARMARSQTRPTTMPTRKPMAMTAKGLFSNQEAARYPKVHI